MAALDHGGTEFLLFHEGDCCMLQPGGAFQRYKGVPADSSCLRTFLLQLEGMFRRLPEDTPREAQALSRAINHQWQETEEDDEAFRKRCIWSAVSNVGENLRTAKQRGGEDGADMDSDVHSWRFHAARVVLQLNAIGPGAH